MRLADVERYVGIPYCERTFDCADLVVRVQRELFERDVVLPNGRPRGARGAALLGDLSQQYATEVQRPIDGDLVLMSSRGRPAHAGVYFFLANEGWILHARRENSVSELIRVRDVAATGSPVGGYFRWV